MEQIRHTPNQFGAFVVFAPQSIDTVVMDRAYFPGSDVEHFQRQMAEAKVKLIGDYKNDETELGKQAFYASPDGRHSLIMVCGSWQLAFMPEALILTEKTYQDLVEELHDNKNLTADKRRELKDEAHAKLRKQRAGRSRYRLVPRSTYFPDGSRQYSYPEFNDPMVMDPDTNKWIEFKSPGKTVKVPGTVHDKDGTKNQKHPKYGQEYEYKSELWRAWYGRRNQIENGNSCLEDVDRASLAIPMTRRMRGPWAVELAGALAALTTNIERIVDWLKLRLAMRDMNRKNRNSAAVFEEGNATLTVEEHDARNPYTRLAELEHLRAIA